MLNHNNTNSSVCCYRCGFLTAEFIGNPGSWQGVHTADGLRLHCPQCVEDLEKGRKTTPVEQDLITCMQCGFVATIGEAIQQRWNIHVAENVVFCSWCADEISEGDDIPLFLSCTSKSQEKWPLSAEGRDWLKWCQVVVGIVLIVSIGWSFHALTLWSLLGSTAMIFVRWYARGGIIKLPPQKPRDKRLKNSVIRAVKHWLERYTQPDIPF